MAYFPKKGAAELNFEGFIGTDLAKQGRRNMVREESQEKSDVGWVGIGKPKMSQSLCSYLDAVIFL